MGSPNYYLRFRFWASQRIRHYLALAFKFTEMEPKASTFAPRLALCSSVCLRYQPLPEYFTDPEIEKQLALAPSFTYPWYSHKALFILHPSIFLTARFFISLFHNTTSITTSIVQSVQVISTITWNLSRALFISSEDSAVLWRHSSQHIRANISSQTNITEARKFTELVVSLVTDSISQFTRLN